MYIVNMNRRIPERDAHPIPDALNLGIVAAQMAGLAACFLLAFRIHGSWSLAALAVGFAILMNSVYSSLHEAEHGILFSDSRANTLTGVALALFFPAPFHLLQQGHLGHHLRNRSDDEAFDLCFEEEHPVWKRIQFYGILTGVYWLIVVLASPVVLIRPSLLKRRHFRFDRPAGAFMDALNPEALPWIRLEAGLILLFHGWLLWGLGMPLLPYLTLYAAFGFSWSAMQYVHHYGTERHVTRGARNLWILPPIDAAWLHHNWHRVHHEHPTIPWCYLPELGKASGESRGFLPFAYLRMWTWPRPASERVQNHYAGQVVRLPSLSRHETGSVREEPA